VRHVGNVQLEHLVGQRLWLVRFGRESNLDVLPRVHAQHGIENQGLLVDEPLLQLRRADGAHPHRAARHADADRANAQPLAVAR